MLGIRGGGIGGRGIPEAEESIGRPSGGRGIGGRPGGVSAPAEGFQVVSSALLGLGYEEVSYLRAGEI